MRRVTGGFVALLVGLVAGCGGGGADDVPVDVTSNNLNGYWYGTMEIATPEGEADPAQGPVFLHLGGALPGVDGLDKLAEWVGVAPLAVGRHSLDGDRLLLDAFSADVGWSPMRQFKVESLTRTSMVLLAETTPPERYRLTRGDSCAAGGVWWSLKPRLDAAAFGPDGRLHLLQEGVYGHGVAGLCYPFERAEIVSSKIAVGPDNRVLLAHVEEGAIVLQRFDAPADATDPVAPEETRLALPEARFSWIYDHLRIGYAGATPVVLFARGPTLHTWHEADGVWSYEALTLPLTDNLTPTDIEVVAAPGELWVRRRRHAEAFVFDAAWRVEPLPAHPTLGSPWVMAFDDKGAMHGAWVERQRALAVWDPLVVGRHDGTAWKTAYAGVGSPWDMRVNRDGSYDLVVAIARRSTSLGHVHVDALAPAKWATHYGPDRFASSALLGDAYLAEEVADQILMQPWGVFSPDGSLLVGGGGEPPFRAAFGLWKNPTKEEAERPGNRRLQIVMDGSVAATVRFPSLGQSCNASCERLVPSQSIVPIVVESAGVVSMTVTTPESVGISNIERLPDGTWAAVFEPDMFGARAYDVTLTVTAVKAAIGAVALLGDEDESSQPLAAVTEGDDHAWVLREVGDTRRIERYDADGTLLVGAEIDARAFAVGAGVLAVTETELVMMNSALEVQSRTAFEAPTGAYRLVMTPDAAITVERRDDGLTGRITVRSPTGTTSHDVPMPRLGDTVVAGDVVGVSSETESYARTVGVAEVPADHLTLAGYGVDGGSQWTLALPKSAFRDARVAAHGDTVVWVVTQYSPFTFAAGSPFAGMPAMTGGALTHVFRVEPDGAFTTTTSTRGPVVTAGSLVATDDGVWLVTSSDAHLRVTFIDLAGDTVEREFTARLAGECVQNACPDGPAVMTRLGDGLAVFHHQRARALRLEDMVLPEILPPLSGRTAFIAVLPFD